MAAIENNENWINFINEYKNLPELWNMNLDSYKNKPTKAIAYEKLTKVYKKTIDKNATMDTVKKRLKNMRFTYKRELKRKKFIEQNGIDGDDPDAYKPNLWYFYHFDFLKDFEQHQTRKRPISSELKIFSVTPTLKSAKSENVTQTYHRRGISTISSDELSIPETPPRAKAAKRMKISKIYDRNDLLRNASMKIQNLSQEREFAAEAEYKNDRDEAEIYAEAWAQSYRKLSSKQKLFAKKACDEIFILGQLDQLTLNSVRIQSSTSFSNHF